MAARRKLRKGECMVLMIPQGFVTCGLSSFDSSPHPEKNSLSSTAD